MIIISHNHHTLIIQVHTHTDVESTDITYSYISIKFLFYKKYIESLIILVINMITMYISDVGLLTGQGMLYFDHTRNILISIIMIIFDIFYIF